MSEVSKVSNTLLNKRSKAMSKVLKVVFAAFTQHRIQSNVSHVTHVRGVKGVLYSAYRTPHPSKREGYLKSLPSCGFSSSPPVSLRRQFC